MARASWKYHFFLQQEIEDYANYLTDYPVQTLLFSRKTTITKLNFYKYTEVYTGKFKLEKYLSKHHIGFKLGALTKTRKPFFFRSKKKNVTKK